MTIPLPSSHTNSAIFARDNFSAVNFAKPQTPVPPGTHPPAPAPAPAPVPLPALQEEQWYLVRDASQPESEGPYVLSQIKLLAGQPGFNFDSAYVFKDGDQEMTPLSKMPGISRRAPRPVQTIQAALPPQELQAEAEKDEWYVYGDENRTYGPYSVDQLREAVDAGHLSRTTYCWRQGMTTWIYAHQIPGFDRRDPGRGTELGPIPLNFPKKPA